ncbi:MAG: hypothetical protein ABFS35_02835 [Bacteroidota bacterium]
MKFITIISLLVFIISTSHAQGDKVEIFQSGQKNLVYGSICIFGPGASANGNYERMIAERNNKFFKTYWFRISGGVYSAWEWGNGIHFITGVTMLSGSGKNHFEFNIGLTSIFDLASSVDNQYIFPAGILGYRYQKKDGHFVFRSGLGFPEIVYFSFGFCF